VSGSRRTDWVVITTFIALLALSAALIAAFQHSIRVADNFTRKDEQQMVARYLDGRMRALIMAQTGQIVWDETVRRTQGKPDLAWMDRELGEFPFTNQGAHESMVVRPDGTLVRAWRQGKPADDYRYGAMRWQVEAVLHRARTSGRTMGKPAGLRRLGTVLWPFNQRGAPLSRWTGAVALRDGELILLTAAAIVPDRTFALLTGEPQYFVTVRPIEPAMLHELGADLLIRDFRFTRTMPEANDGNAVPATAADGTRLGYFAWRGDMPGPVIWRGTAPLLVSYIVLFMAVLIGGTVIVRRMHRTTRELQVSEAQAQHNALHDPMSGLANRVHFMDRLRSALGEIVASEQGGDVFVAYIDLDAFKSVNDTMGHHVGDQLVKQVAARLHERLLPDDMIARFGGDEFVIMRCATGGLSAANALGRQIVGAMADPFIVSGHSLGVTCSCGISWGPDQSDDPGELLRRADIALYRAKEGGRARYRCYTNGMDASERLQRELEVELRHALAADELEPHFQPIIDLATGQIEGFEALLRWPHLLRGNITPATFIPIAEQCGLMVPLGTWMLRRVFAECRAWPSCDISINLSPLQIMAHGFVETVEALVQETRIDPARVILEVTESVMLDRSEQVAESLRALQHMGFRIALDDFGTGYSSLSYLRSFQFDRIKIDRSFVQHIESDGDAQAILSAIADLGQMLRMKVVAEGVETVTQQHLVRAAGCEMAQGYLYWPALPVTEARALLSLRPADGLRCVG